MSRAAGLNIFLDPYHLFSEHLPTLHSFGAKIFTEWKIIAAGILENKNTASLLLVFSALVSGLNSSSSQQNQESQGTLIRVASYDINKQRKCPEKSSNEKLNSF